MSKYEVHSAVREWYEDESLSAVPCVRWEADADTLEEAKAKVREIENSGELISVIFEDGGIDALGRATLKRVES